MDLQPAKMGIKERDEYNECDQDGYSTNPAMTNCVKYHDSFTIESGIDPTQSSTLEFFDEKILSSRVVLECLSFSGECGCDNSKCSLATKEVRVQSNITDASQQ
jgi:hypothetical protein